MQNEFKLLAGPARWHVLVGAAKRAIEEEGHTIARLPGRGLSNIWTMEKNRQSQTVAIRTTQDRYFAFPPLSGGKKWKTLDDVDLVAVASVDDVDDPKKVEVYLFPAKEVRKRFDASYAARRNAGNVLIDDFGMWVGLDKLNRGVASDTGSGIAEIYPPLVVYPIEELLSLSSQSGSSESEKTEETIEEDEGADKVLDSPSTIADVVNWAREQIARIAGVKREAVKLDLKLEI
jgi:hypothetical protein